MSVDNHLHLEVRDILQRIKDAIGNETLWIKHYKNLREIEKDLPESVKQDEAGKNVEMPDSLYKLNISDFLRLEQKTYPDKSGTVSQIISKIEQLSIPGVFNFRERLKLTLCAACHINTVPVYRNINNDIDKIVENFKQLKAIEFESDATIKPVRSNNERANNISALETQKKEIENQKKLSIDKLEAYRTKRQQNTNTRKPVTRSSIKILTGGSNYEVPNVDSIFELFKGKQTNQDPITAFREAYKKFISTKNTSTEEMYTYLDQISFNAHAEMINHPLLLEALKKGFEKFVEKKIKDLHLKQRDGVLKALNEKITHMKFQDFSKYLKNYYYFGPSGYAIKVGDGKKKTIDVKNEDEFKQFYTDTPILLFASPPIQPRNNNGAEETKQATEDAEISKTIFERYIHELFQNMYIDLIFDKNNIEIIDREIKELKNEEKHEGRKKDIQERRFDEAGNPLLMMFLLFVRDCVHTMSQKIISGGKDDFWHQLEESIGNGIRLDDETLQCKNEGNETSLFAYLEEQLKKSEEEKGQAEGEDGKIKILIIIAKLIYLLQNYHYF